MAVKPARTLEVLTRSGAVHARRGSVRRPEISKHTQRNRHHRQGEAGTSGEFKAPGLSFP
jgi:hypothetical protein